MAGPLPRLLPWLLALLLLATSAATFWPGVLSWDSAYQWYQVRTGEWTSVHPALMTALWSLTDRLLPGPGGYFLLQLSAWWLGLAALATGLFERTRAQLACLLGLGLFLPVLALLPHLWKDIGLLAGLVWTIALLVRELRRPHRGLLLAAFATLVLACGFRHNAVPLALPLLWYLAGRWRPGLRRGPRLLATLALALVLALLAQLPNHMAGVERRAVWPVTATWDLAAVSIATDTQLLPAEIVDPDLRVADLRRDFVPWVAVPIYASGKIRDSVGPVAMTDAQLRALRTAWLAMVRQHPMDYLQHRARLAGYLFGFDPAGRMVFDYRIVALADNPVLSPASSPLRRSFEAVVAALAGTPLFAFWLHALVLVALAASLPGRPVHPLLPVLLLSAALLVLPLLIAAPGADFRFLAWPVFVGALGVALAVAGAPRAATGGRP
jgi:hypothetical protein